MIVHVSCRRRPADKAGFTLVEMLVVLVIVALTAAFVTLRIGVSPATLMEDEGSRLQQVLESGIDQSRLARATTTWRADPGGYALAVAADGKPSPGRRHELAEPVRILAVWLDGVPQSPPYEIPLSIRQPSLFRIRLGTEQTAMELRSTALGTVERLPGR